jgi:D-alanyl-lipoteichoic acid acyltransferase DltB (MBOAT superfamily)
MLLGGLWHGASLNFVIWGAGHGLLLSIERFIKNFNFTLFGDDSTPQIFKKSDFWRFLFKIVRVVFVYFWVCVLWIFFRAKDIHSATFIVKKLLLFSHGNSIGYTNQSIIFLVFFLVFCCHIIGSKFSNQIMGFVDKEKSYIFTFLISIITILLFLLSRENRPFIYFVF